LVGREDPSLRKALLSAGGVEVIEAASADAVTPESVDVVVFVDTAASEDWGGPACFVNPRASIGPIRVGGGSGPVPEDTWVVRNRDSGLGRWLYLPGPKVKRLQNVDLIGDAEVVVGEKERPMVVAWQGDSELKKRIAVLFDISSDGTDWPLLPSYPVFWAGVLASLAPGPRHTGDVYVTHSPHESVEFMRPNRGAGSGQRLGRASRSSPGFIRDGRGGGEGEIVAGVSFIADKERKWLSGPMVDQTRAATEAIGEVLARSATAGRRELWPLLAIFAAVATLLRLFWLR
ncbi:MAG: hypothetical protein QGD94_04305, partial [Planctomycetia bacterium]|nr:hypothetical protein [Planctomycetia bacterium]